MGSIFNNFFNKDKENRKPGEIIYMNDYPEMMIRLNLRQIFMDKFKVWVFVIQQHTWRRKWV